MRTNREANGKATQEAPVLFAPREANSAGGWRRLDNLIPLVVLVLVVVSQLYVLKMQTETTQAARQERLEREEAARKEAEAGTAHERLMKGVREREAMRAADVIHQQEEARKIAEENLRLTKELNKQLRKGE